MVSPNSLNFKKHLSVFGKDFFFWEWSLSISCRPDIVHSYEWFDVKKEFQDA